MKPKASDKAVVTARERARTLENKARQLGQAVRAAKDKARQAKNNLKLAKQEAKQARKAAKDAKRDFTEAVRAADEAAAEIAALEKRTPAAGGKARPARASSRKPGQAPARKRVSTKAKRRAAAPKSIVVKRPVRKAIPAMPVSVSGSMPAQTDRAVWELNIGAPGDIAPVSPDIFAGSSPQGDASALPGSITNDEAGGKP